LLTVVGLGNPGQKYKKTKHNTGFMLLDGIIDGRFMSSAQFNQSGLAGFKSIFGIKGKFKKTTGPFVKIEGSLYSKRFLLIKPTTFMNESGKAFASLKTRGLIKDFSELLVVVDDVDLTTGTIRLRDKGSAGGHNGLKSIINHLGTNEFPRLRIGVGPRPDGREMVDYVLGSFHPDEFDALEESLKDASEVVEGWISGGYKEAQNIISTF
jgi:peptidyl-tRNA hydrolase, PTH1 family